MEIKKIDLTDCTVLTVQDFGQVYYEILSIILLKEYIKLNVKTIIHAVLNTQMLKMT